MFLSTAAPQTLPGGEPRYISTIVGNGVPGFNGDGLPGRSTSLFLPQHGDFGPDGYFYFADWNSERIRRLVFGENVVEAVAGEGHLGEALDAPAMEIRLNHPTGVSFDRQGRLLLSCWHNSKVKRLDFTTGMVTNIAGTGFRGFGGDGGQGNTATLDLPSSTVVDSQGNVYISDQANFRLRRLDPSGILTTICGTGTAGYSGDGGPPLLARIRSPVGQSAAPAGRLAIDSQDRIYIADTSNHAIRRLDADGMIRTIAGTGQAGYTGDDGPATAARLNTPSDVAVGSDGMIYIADTMNHAVRRVTPDGVITTIAGTGIAGFSGDGGLARAAKLNRPYAVAVAPDGRVMISDTYNNRLRILTEEPVESGPEWEEPEVEITPCTAELGSICTYAGTGYSLFDREGKDRQRTHLYWPMDIEFTPSGRVYVVDWNNHRIRQILSDQTFQTVIGTEFPGDGPPDFSDRTAPGSPGITVSVNHPMDLQEFPSGELIVLNWHNFKIRQFDPQTSLVRILLGAEIGFAGDGGPAKNARVNQAAHGVLDAAGNFFFIDQRNERLRMIRNFATLREEAPVTTIAGTGEPGFNGDGPALSTQVSFPTGTNPEPTGGITVGANGVIYFADTNNHRIRSLRFNGPEFTDGVIATIAGTGTPGYSGDGGLASEAQINQPGDLELGPDGKLYFADTNNNRIRRIDLTARTIETVAGTGAAGYSGDGGPALAATFNRPFGIAFDAYGNLYIADTFNNRIRKVKLTTVPEGPDPILPADYLTSYIEVRDCRFSQEHGGVYIRVLTNPEAATAYRENANPLPAGTVVVKEEYSDGCESADLVRWRVMRKEPPGFDSGDGDWHWQMLTPRREVVEDVKDSCISCHRQLECRERDYMCTLPRSSDGLKVVLDNLPATLTSVSGTPADGPTRPNIVNFDVYAVGADPGDGRGPFVLRFDGEKWHRLASGARGDLWWISDRPIEGDFYMVGANGLILRHSPGLQSFEPLPTPGGKLLFGVWGVDRQSLWAVGGDLTDEDRGGAIWKFNGTRWVVDESAWEARPQGLPTLYKVWGSSPSDVYVVGRLGLILHFDGERWTTVPTGTTQPLIGVHGNGARVVAAGGAFEGILLELEGEAFVDRTPIGSPQFNGVFVTAGPTVVVGAEGSHALPGAGAWELQPPVTASRPFDLHGAWIDAAGGVWAVGGDLTVNLDHGVLTYSGHAPVGPEFLSDGPCLAGSLASNQTVSYSRDILPILRKSNCLNSTCHGSAAPQSEYDLRTYEGMFGPGVVARNHGMCDIVPGKPEASLLIEKLRPQPRVGEQMPNGYLALNEDDYQTFVTWIREGATRDGTRRFARGDSNLDDRSDMSDAVTVLGYLFLGAPSELGCEQAADMNDDGRLDISDAGALLGHLFLGLSPLPAPAFPDCGYDPTADDLSCRASRCE
jgi:sugar lactone lactonase YvrE